MSIYALFVQDRETKYKTPVVKAEAKSRRAFIKTNAKELAQYRRGKFQYQIGLVAG